jgi:YVTN family beta-propeller protein
MNSILCSLTLLALPVAAQKPDIAVVEKKAGMVGFYTLDGKRLSEVKVGQFPHELILSEDNRHIYVSDNGLLWMTDPGEGWNTISIIEVATRRKTGIIDLGKYRRPHGMDLDPKTGRLVVTIENPFGLLLVDPKTRKVVRMYDVKGESPHMVLFGPRHETAYVSNARSGTVAIVNLSSGAVKLLQTGKNPQGGVMTRDSKTIYLTNSESSTISIIDTATQTVTGEIATGPGAARIALTPDEKTLVYNLGAGGNAVAFADVASRKQTAVIPLVGRPLSLSLSRDGALAFLGVQDSDKIAIVSVKEKKLQRYLDTPKNSGPDTIFALP